MKRIQCPLTFAIVAMGEANEIDGVEISEIHVFDVDFFHQGKYDEWVQVAPKKNLSPSLSSIVNVKSSNIQDGRGNRLTLQLITKENMQAKE